MMTFRRFPPASDLAAGANLAPGSGGNKGAIWIFTSGPGATEMKLFFSLIKGRQTMSGVYYLCGKKNDSK